MTTALILLCVMFAITTVCLTGVCITMQRTHAEQLREQRSERLDLVNRVIAKHGLEVAHLDRVQIPSDIERVERQVHDQVGM